MWPWEHLAVGYLGYSLCVHLVARRAPESAAVVALALGTQFPDLVDKPLAWAFGVLPSGYSLGHSVFAAVPLSVLAVVTAWRFGRTRIGAAFAFGYLSHLPGDVLYPALVGGEPAYTVVLWPLVSADTAATTVGLVAKVGELFGGYVTEVASGELGTYLAVEFALLASVFLLWLLDGMPPLAGVFARTDRSPTAEEASERREDPAEEAP